ncbi:MAG: hypothetical protein ACRCZF_23185, partial [Gemmataceae bacterium]
MQRFQTLLAFGLLLVGQAIRADERPTENTALATAEARLKSIYLKREFAPAPFAGKWLADSSGYLMLEAEKPGTAPDIVKYGLADGKRTVLIGAAQLVPTGSIEK